MTTPSSMSCRVLLLVALACAPLGCIEPPSADDNNGDANNGDNNAAMDLGPAEDMARDAGGDEEDMAPTSAVVELRVSLMSEQPLIEGATAALVIEGVDDEGAVVAPPPVVVTAQDLDRDGEVVAGDSAVAWVDGTDTLAAIAPGSARVTVQTRDEALSATLDVEVIAEPDITAPGLVNTIAQDASLDLDELFLLSGGGTPRPIDTECSFSASGAIAVQGRALTATRTGYGALTLRCTLPIFRAGDEMERTYHFTVLPSPHVAAREAQTCGVLNGDLRCWGLNDAAQLGNTVRRDQTIPLAVENVPQARDVALGWRHGCAVTPAGELFCWGANADDQVWPGLPEQTRFPKPTKIDLPHATFARTCAGEAFSCGLTDRGQLLCWGLNAHGALGERVALGAHSEAQVEPQPGRRYREVACGAAHICATTLDGTSECWGDDTYGQSAAGATAPARTQPVQVSGDAGALAFEALALSERSSCGITLSRELYCWGDNRDGQLTDSIDAAPANTPQRITFPVRERIDVDAIALGDRHGCAQIVKPGSEYETYCWGAHDVGQLGLGDAQGAFVAAPTRVEQMNIDGTITGLPRLSGIAVGAQHTCAMPLEPNTINNKKDGICWGRSANGRLGTGQDGIARFSMTQPSFDFAALDWESLALGEQHGCVAGEDTLWCWGSNLHGERGGGGATSQELAPEELSVLSPIGELTAGTHHTCGLDASNNVTCWGLSAEKQSGETSGSDYQTPGNSISGGAGKRRTAHALGSTHSCMLTNLVTDNTVETGDVFCWGDNRRGALGMGEVGGPLIGAPFAPLDFGNVRDMSYLVSRGDMACAWNKLSALFSELYCWGHDPTGLMFEWDESLPEDERIQWTPEEVRDWGDAAQAGLKEAVIDVGLGDEHACVLQESGKVTCWGRNTYGQLGAPDIARASVDAPHEVQIFTGARQLVTGRAHNCVRTDNTIHCWGDNRRGQVGQVDSAGVVVGKHAVTSPYEVLGNGDGFLVEALAAGDENTCALLRPSNMLDAPTSIHCWGANDVGQSEWTGEGSWTRQTIPRRIDW